MKKSELREKILDECPDEFKNDLEDWINEIEELINESLKSLEGSIDTMDIEDFNDAWQMLNDLSYGIY